MVRWVLIGALCAGLCSQAEAQFGRLEGIAFHILHVGSYGQSRAIFDLTAEEFDAFTSFRVSADQELSQVWQTMRQELVTVQDEESHAAWRLKHGPLITQINYDLWQRAVGILKTDERIKKYHRTLVQEYLRHGPDIRCLAAIVGVEPTWAQYQELQEKFAKTPIQVQNSLADRRREIEEDLLAKHIEPATLREMRGEEFQWTTQPPDLDRFGPDFFEEEFGTSDKSLIQIATHSDVLAALEVSAESRKVLSKAFEESGADEDDDGFFELSAILGAAKTPEQRLAIQQELVARKQNEEQELLTTISSALTPPKFRRLIEIAIQQRLQKFQYVRLAQSLGIEVDRKARRDLQNLAQQARQEMEYAKAQKSIDFNAKAFDEVMKTNLSSSIGKIENYVGNHFFGGNLPGQQRPPTAKELFADRYGNKPTSELTIPKVLTDPPAERILWDDVEVPEGWTLEDAVANLEKWRHDIDTIVVSNKEWNQKQDDLRSAMSEAARGGDPELAKKLRTEYSTEFSGRSYFNSRRQFREAAEIAQEELIKARRIVKKLGGDPGHVKDIRHLIR